MLVFILTFKKTRMTQLINKKDSEVVFVFTYDRITEGDIYLSLKNTYDTAITKYLLPKPNSVGFNRYVKYTVVNTFLNLPDGLYTYDVTDLQGSLETGSLKIQSDDFGSFDPLEYHPESENSDYIVYNG